ncbi:uncharacterized protein LOC124405668 [Diprion similis]|uniref:uncharacterized protein LOC124405668 n=1 Tax=Diprion similis TaxID=362088 RepID=UPI001EF8F7B1|nr:uncharacterized protein LOC124405668 [Diprion similis]
MENENGFIDLNGSESESQVWVHVLPSFKKGKVISISKKIPQTCSFSSYQQLKEYWKNMYGYNLPESDVGLIYYQVCFPWSEQSFYHYPSCCVKSVQPTQLFPDNGEHITKQFVQDLTERVPNICGSTLKLQEPTSRPPSDSWQKNDHKENISNQSSWVARSTNKISNKKFTPCNSQSSSNPGNELPVNYLAQIDVNYLGALTTLSNNSGPSRLMHNVIKEKNLKDALNMKQFQSTGFTDKRILADCYEKFFPPEKKSKISPHPSNLCIEEPGSLRLSDNHNIKVETMCSSELIKSDSDKSQSLNKISEELDDVSLNYMLRKRSSFDLNDFCAGLDEKNLHVGLVDENIALCTEKSDIDKNEVNGPNSVLEVKSHYFTDIPNEVQCNKSIDLVCTSLQEDKQSGKIKPLSKLKFNQLFGRKVKTQRTCTINSKKHMQKRNFKTNDIDSYFREKKQVNVSHFAKVPIKPSMPKLIQTCLAIQSSGKIELCGEIKKEGQYTKISTPCQKGFTE